MNERIKQLMTEVGISVEYLTNTKQIILLEKFAELIVRECAKYMYTNYPETRYKVNYMRKHLGDPNWNISIGDE